MQSQFDPIPLNHRAVITISGTDRKNFLQGLITNNIEKISQQEALYAALLSPQGKYLHDFFISESGDTLFLDCERERLPDLFRRLMMYKLRADVEITDCSDNYSILATSNMSNAALVSCPDPRLSEMGFRSIHDVYEHKASDQYNMLRLIHGLPEGSRDFDIDRTLILEGNLEQLNGVDFDKGCYVGQEVTARMKHRANLKKRLLPIKVDGPLPERGTVITDENGKKIGDIRSGQDNMAIGYFRLAQMEFDKTYACGNAIVTPWQPDWLMKEEI